MGVGEGWEGGVNTGVFNGSFGWMSVRKAVITSEIRI